MFVSRISLALSAGIIILSLQAGCRGATELPDTWEEAAAASGQGNNNGAGKAQRINCPAPGELPFPLANEGKGSKTPGAPDHLIEDLIANPGGEQVLRGRALSDALQIAVDPIGRTPASFWMNRNGAWEELGSGNTDGDGFLSVTIPAEKKLEKGAHRIYFVLESDGSCAEGGAFIYPEGSKLLITDIDETITTSDEEIITQMSNRDYVPAEREDGATMLQAYANKGYYIFYLTARPYHHSMVTRVWLNDIAAPFGALETADSFVFGESARSYKAGFVNRLQNDLGFIISIAYGNAESDIDAYEAGGIAKDITFIIGENAGASGTTAITSEGYTQHISEFVSTFPDANQP